MDEAPYVLRLSVKVRGKEPIRGLDPEQIVSVGTITVAVKQRWPFLILSASDFATESEAIEFLARLKGGLFNIALQHNIAFSPFFERREITRPKCDPIEAAHNLAKSFGATSDAPLKPVHGLTEEEGYTIFRSDENIRYLAMGEVSGHVSTAWTSVSETLFEGIQNAQPVEVGSDIVTALDLYLSNFYETSPRARFLTLMTCLEVLAPVTQRHPSSVQAIFDFQDRVGVQLATVEDGEERDALESLLREIDFKKETSIRRRIRKLILTEAPLTDEDKRFLAKKVVDAYDLRSTVVHSGRVPSEALFEALDTALAAVKLLLSARLNTPKIT